MEKFCKSYRNLCNYDEFTNSCESGGSPPIGGFSYSCVNTGYGGNSKSCVRMNKSPGGSNSYSNMQECTSNCGRSTSIASRQQYSNLKKSKSIGIL